MGVKIICNMIKKMNIQTLDISGNFITQKSIEYLRDLCNNNSSIKRIVFENSSLQKK